MEILHSPDITNLMCTMHNFVLIKNVDRSICRLVEGVCFSHQLKFKCVHMNFFKPFKYLCRICSTTVLQIPIILNVSVGMYVLKHKI